ncbi:MAG: GspE/PulE family protein [Rhodothermales bacterium]
MSHTAIQTPLEPELQNVADRDRVVVRLRRKGVLDDATLRAAWGEWQATRNKGIRVPLWRMLALSNDLDSNEVFAEAARVYAFTFAKIDEERAIAFVNAQRESFSDDAWDDMVEHYVMPVGKDRDPATGEPRWLFATHDPTRPEVHQLVQGMRLRRFEVQYAPEDVVGRLVSQTFLQRNLFLDRLEDEPATFDMGSSFESEAGLVDEDALEAEMSRSRLINLFEAALIEAVKRGASDIHIYPNQDGFIEIHMRIDGELQSWHMEESVRPESFLAVVKDNATNVDRFDRDTAQDGYIQRWVDDTMIRFRVSVLPIASRQQGLHAESVVIRVLDDRKVLTDLRKIGLAEDAYSRFQDAIRQPHGMVILTGPTGSGKSTTLVAALHQVITPKVNVLTVEDPVEYLMRGVRQIKLGPRLDLEGALRAILRHDPDVVMVGEMRDRPTAELAIKLANTGHLTFSTLHTNDAPSAVSRLFKMGVEPFLIAYAINIVVAQRLVRNLCPTCRIPDPNPDFVFLEHVGFKPDDIYGATFYQAGGHANCKTCKGAGYKGRRAIAETMLFNQKIRSIIMASEDIVDEDGLRDAAVADGMVTLEQAARQLVITGETSVAEAIRVTGT